MEVEAINVEELSERKEAYLPIYKSVNMGLIIGCSCKGKLSSTK